MFFSYMLVDQRRVPNPSNFFINGNLIYNMAGGWGARCSSLFIMDVSKVLSKQYFRPMLLVKNRVISKHG